MDAGNPICTCCKEPVDELVTAPRKDGSPQEVCQRCRDTILGRAAWVELLATTRLEECADGGQ